MAELHGLFELSVTNATGYSNKYDYTVIELTAQFTSPTGIVYNWYGFHDGDGAGGQTGNVWRVRFRPNEVGTWNYTMDWSDATTNPSPGSFSCVDTGLYRGHLKVAMDNPWYFMDARNAVVHARPYDVQSWLYFATASKDIVAESANYQAVLQNDVINRSYNMVMWQNQGYVGEPTAMTTTWYEGSGTNKKRFNCSVFKTHESALTLCANANVYAFPFSIFGQGSQPANLADAQVFLKYWLARFAPYFNFFGFGYLYEWEDILSPTDASAIGQYLKNNNPWPTMLSMHDASYSTFTGWLTFSMRQGQTTSVFTGNSRRAGVQQISDPNGSGGIGDPFINKPILGSEDIWESTAGTTGLPTNASEVRRGAWGEVLAGVIPVYSRWVYSNTNLGESSVRRMFDFVYTRTRYRQWVQKNSLVDSGSGQVCSGITGTEYLVYDQGGGSITINLSEAPASTNFTVSWFNPADGTESSGSPVLGGASRTIASPFGSNDSVLLLVGTTGGSGTIVYTQDFSSVPSGGTFLLQYPPGSPDFVNILATGPGRLFVNDGSGFPPNVCILSDFGSTHYVRCVNPSSPTGDQQVSASVFTTTISVQSTAGLLVRCATDNSANFYEARVTPSIASEVEIARWTNGVRTVIASADRGISNTDATRTWRFSASGINPVRLELQIDASATLVFLDSDPDRKQSGTWGAYANGHGDTNYLDNIVVDSVTGGGGGPPPPTGSSLSALTASMQNGTWGQLLGVTGGQAFTGPPGTNGVDGSILIFASCGYWDAGSRKVYFIGSDHTPVDSDHMRRFVTFDDATNSCRVESSPSFVDVPGTNHGYGHSRGRPGKFFEHGGSNPHIYDIPTGVWSSQPSFPGAIQHGFNGTDYFAARSRRYVAGSTEVWYLQDGGSVWNLETTRAMGDFHCFCVVSPIANILLFGGGENDFNKVWRMSSTGTVTQLSNSPVSLGQNSNRVTYDPVGGNFLVVCGDGNLRQLNASTDTWSVASSQPSQVTSGISLNSIIAIPIETYGCVLFMVGQNDSDPLFWVYKTGSATGDVTAPIVSNVIPTPGPGTTSETISFNTNEAASSFVRYGETTLYGTNTTAGSLLNAHSHVLTGLATDGRTMHYQIVATDASGNTKTEPDRVFTTQVVTGNPVISNVVASPGSTSFNVAWNTSPVCQTTLRWGLSPTSLPNTVNDSVLKSSHSVTVTPVAADTDHYYQIVATASGGQQTTGSVTIIHTTPQPTASTFPTVANELAAYARTLSGVTKPKVSWTLPPTPSFSTDPWTFGHDPNSQINFHDGSEADDLWTYAHQAARYGASAGFLNTRLAAWLSFYTSGQFRAIMEVDQGRGNDHSYGYDHFYGPGLQAANSYSPNASAITELRNLANVINGYWQNEVGNPSAFPMSEFGGRGPARHLLLMVSAAEATGDVALIQARDRLINLWMNSSTWDASRPPGGMYFYGIGDTDQTILGPGAYDRGGRVAATFQTGIITEALAQAARVTGRLDIKQRIVQMATFCIARAIDPVFQYPGSFFGFYVNTSNQIFSFIDYSFWDTQAQRSVIFWDTNYTASLVNLMVYAYKYTGDNEFLGWAFWLWERHNGGPGLFSGSISNPFSSTAGRTVPNDVLHHRADVRFSSSDNNLLFDYNKGELQYVYRLFENGGFPTVESVSDVLAPTIVTATVTNITNTTATVNVTWNEAADIEIQYGTSIPYASTTGLFPTKQAVHAVSLQGLPSASTINYKVLGADVAGNTNSTEPNRTFATLAAADTTAPVITGLQLLVSTTSIDAVFSTNEPARGKVLTGTLSPPTTSTPAAYAGSFVTSHRIVVTGLLPATTYFVQPRAIDIANNENISQAIVQVTTLPVSTTGRRRGTFIRRIVDNPPTYHGVVWVDVPIGFEKFYANSRKRSILADLTAGHPAVITDSELADLQAGKYEEFEFTVQAVDLAEAQAKVELEWNNRLSATQDVSEFAISGRTWDSAGNWNPNP